MKRLLFLLTSAGLLAAAEARGQAVPSFTVSTLTTKVRKQAADYGPANPPLYEDETYVVRGYCNGEFGGGLLFRHKATGGTYTCEATCPLTVFNLQGRYVVSCTLAHMAGFVRVLEIADPQQLLAVPTKRRKVKLTDAQIQLLRTGAKVLADTMRVFISGSFPLQGQLYYVLTDFKTTYLAGLQNGHFIPLARLADFSTWSYRPEVRKTADGHYLFFYENDTAQGYLDVYDTTINVVRYP